jgi:site-specific DNA-methyltransferase (adenine-specific)
MAHAAKKGILKNGKRWFPNENGKLCNDVWEITSQRHKEKVNGKVQTLAHPTIKPYEMIERIVKASSNENDLVLDLFSGSGMTSVVSRDLNRRFIGCERDSNYISYIESEGIKIGRL